MHTSNICWPSIAVEVDYTIWIGIVHTPKDQEASRLPQANEATCLLTYWRLRRTICCEPTLVIKLPAQGVVIAAAAEGAGADGVDRTSSNGASVVISKQEQQLMYYLVRRLLLCPGSFLLSRLAFGDDVLCARGGVYTCIWFQLEQRVNQYPVGGGGGGITGKIWISKNESCDVVSFQEYVGFCRIREI